MGLVGPLVLGALGSFVRGALESMIATGEERSDTVWQSCGPPFGQACGFTCLKGLARPVLGIAPRARGYFRARVDPRSRPRRWNPNERQRRTTCRAR